MNETVPETMRVIATTGPGGAEVLRVEERPVPRPEAGEVLIRLAATGVNRPDILQRMGAYPPPPGATDLLGLEGAGEVVAIGTDVTALSVGDRVCALLPGGGYADYCVTPAAHCLPVPQGYDLEKAAALPETILTVWANVVESGALKAGETLLVHGGSSGIGTMAIQIGRWLGASVIVTAGSDEKCQLCERLGAEKAINYRNEDFVAVIKEMTGGKGVDVVLDMVGGSYIPRNLKALAVEGRHVSIAFLEGSEATVNFARVMMRRQVMTGSTLRARSDAEKARLVAEIRKRIWPALESGDIKPVICKSFDLEQASDAHRLMESSTHMGKILLRQ
ncbi:NAD(P)H-quinone oxidoreductase [Pseudohoeflea coraliihabitans]|uniref:NAD(P)H-quinone oxidoreductase n=1 Tax=Pseudohoeflea coraliihabitans TaxID=2860393 RepID=A0ABS6WKF8_9HYPH|nr:NAD(P)H-quinone oxidoreductase [Pseudohoeflea sp. DP4N28-3]MBW3096428.1 NAD(P)H-quinone oxidoreductase [Pseudohoeflea sp. DP4N28-3]